MGLSGSTGNPKGVMITHENLLVTLNALLTRLGDVSRKVETYVCYLPLAHVLELVCEFGCVFNGIRLAYSSPQTLTDNSTGVIKGHLSDIRLAKPTILATVPIVLERLSKGFYEKLREAPWLKQTLFKMAYEQKLALFKASRNTRLLDRIVFKPINRLVLGGEVRLILSGGALLSKDVQELAQVCFGPVLQAYGLTETCVGATAMYPHQVQSETCGSVIPCSEIRLRDWAEAGYRATDKPNPRGEILVGGDNITMGYFKMPEKTREDYRVIDGVKYFATGDIGEVLPNGNLKIIDRKKDLVKLQGGEYVSLNKLENAIKLLPFVDNCCVIANPLKAHCVCLICPNVIRVADTIRSIDMSARTIIDVYEELNENKKLRTMLYKELYDECARQNCDRFEIPTAVKFVREIWLDCGLLTDSFKLKRKEIESFYSKDIQKLYEQ